MRIQDYSIRLLSIGLFCLTSGVSFAQQANQVVVTGESSVSIEGKSATTGGDVTNDGAVVTGNSSNVFIGGKPAATVGADTNCGGTVSTGASTVFVNGKPLANTGSSATDCKK
ncbi:MAG: PAAR domain-containing protein [Pseudomonadota bacterium]